MRSLNDMNKEIANVSVDDNKNIEIGSETFNDDNNLDEDGYNEESIHKKKIM